MGNTVATAGGSACLGGLGAHVATVLAYSSPGCGHLFPLCALLTGLSKRGHRIHLRTTQDAQHIGRQLGFHTEAIDPRIEEISGQDWTARSTY